MMFPRIGCPIRAGSLRPPVVGSIAALARNDPAAGRGSHIWQLREWPCFKFFFIFRPTIDKNYQGNT